MTDAGYGTPHSVFYTYSYYHHVWVYGLIEMTAHNFLLLLHICLINENKPSASNIFPSVLLLAIDNASLHKPK